MTFKVRICSYPNNETRATFFQERSTSLAIAEENSTDVPEDSSHLTLSKKSKRSVESSAGNDSGDDIRPGYGKVGKKTNFSTYARRVLLRAGAAFDKSVPLGECLFLTGTCPGSTSASWEALAAWSSWVVHRVKAWIGKRQSSKLDFYVWEFQKRGALHLHYAVHIANDDAREYIKANWKTQWIRLLTSIQKETGVEMWRKNKNYTHEGNKSVTQADVTVIEKSVARYLSKYLSKANAKQNGFGNRREFFPARWYGVSRPLLKLTESLTRVVERVFSSRRQAEAFFEEVTHQIESVCIRAFKWRCGISFSSLVFGYTDPAVSTSIHPVLEEIMSEFKCNMHEAESLRSLLVMTGVILLNTNGRFKDSFIAILGDCAYRRYRAMARGHVLPIVEQIAFIHDVEYVCKSWRLSYDTIPIACSTFLRNAKSWDHLLSDGDGEIAKTEVKILDSSGRIIDLEEDEWENAVRHRETDDPSGHQLSIW